MVDHLVLLPTPQRVLPLGGALTLQPDRFIWLADDPPTLLRAG